MGLLDKAKDVAATTKEAQHRQRMAAAAEATTRSREAGKIPWLDLPCKSARGRPARLHFYKDRIEFVGPAERGRPGAVTLVTNSTMSSRSRSRTSRRSPV